MSDDIFSDIDEQLKKLNNELSTYGKSLVGIVGGIRDDLKADSVEPSAEPSRKPAQKKEESITQKLIAQLKDVSKRYGKANLVSNAGHSIAQRAAEISQSLGIKIGSDGASQDDPKSSRSGATQTAPAISNPVKQAIGAIQQQIQGMAVQATKVNPIDAAPPKAGTLMGQALKRSPAAIEAVTPGAGIGAAGAAVGEDGAAAAGAVVGGGALAGLTGATAGIAAVVAAVTAACAALAVGVLALTKKMIESARELAKVNGKIAAAFAISQIRGLKRDINTGATTGDSTAKLIRTFDDFKDRLAPIGNKLTNLVNTILTRIVGFFNKLIDFFKPLLDGIGSILDTLEEWFGETKKKDIQQYQPLADFYLDRQHGKNRHDPLFRWADERPKRK